MNKIFILITATLLFLNTEPVFSKDIFKPAKCHQPNKNNITLTLKDNIKINLPVTQKSCASSFAYSASMNDTITILAGPGPSELGLNAQHDIYITSENEPAAKYIGSIPVTANPISESKFKDVTQSGGSIFEAIYHITRNSIELDPESLELIFSDTQCILKNKDSKRCVNISGTFEKPICITNSNGKKILQEKSHCADLEKEIGQ